ncbi:MAG TPA: folylpolyglutamate synthase/dihydrofolate synthase family protein [Chthoniobacterales bacterium]
MNEAYAAALASLFDLQTRGVKLGLENVRRLLAGLGHPERGLPCIHVAGTNGKGSTCAMLAALGRAAGLRTGLFTSPHLIRFNERIQVDDKPISDDEVVSGLHAIRVRPESEASTFFEVTTALAFLHFRAKNVDLVVLETGLGGRLDATNVVTPVVSVITTIDLDHQAILGQTEHEIAREKAGIIKPGVPVVSGPQSAEARSVLEAVAAQRNAPFRLVTEPETRFSLGLFGSYQQVNAAVALTAVAAAGLNLPEQTIRRCLQNVVWPGRFQIVTPDLVLDGAHNPSACRQLARTWREFSPVERAVVIFGGLRDKALADMLAALAEIAIAFYFVPVRNRRGAAPDAIASQAVETLPHRVFTSPAEALATAEGTGRKTLITGSLFLVGEVLALLAGKGGHLQRSDQ